MESKLPDRELREAELAYVGRLRSVSEFFLDDNRTYSRKTDNTPLTVTVPFRLEAAIDKLAIEHHYPLAMTFVCRTAPIWFYGNWLPNASDDQVVGALIDKQNVRTGDVFECMAQIADERLNAPGYSRPKYGIRKHTVIPKELSGVLVAASEKSEMSEQEIVNTSVVAFITQFRTDVAPYLESGR